MYIKINYLHFIYIYVNIYIYIYIYILKKGNYSQGKVHLSKTKQTCLNATGSGQPVDYHVRVEMACACRVPGSYSRTLTVSPNTIPEHSPHNRHSVQASTQGRAGEAVLVKKTLS